MDKNGGLNYPINHLCTRGMHAGVNRKEPVGWVKP